MKRVGQLQADQVWNSKLEKLQKLNSERLLSLIRTPQGVRKYFSDKIFAGLYRVLQFRLAIGLVMLELTETNQKAYVYIWSILKIEGAASSRKS